MPYSRTPRGRTDAGTLDTADPSGDAIRNRSNSAKIRRELPKSQILDQSDCDKIGRDRSYKPKIKSWNSSTAFFCYAVSSLSLKTRSKRSDASAASDEMFCAAFAANICTRARVGALTSRRDARCRLVVPLMNIQR